jgi:hypothetical protein
MAYLPKWDSLPESLRRVVSPGLLKSEAQHNICRALAERKIRFRLWVEKIETPDGVAVGGRRDGSALNPPSLNRLDVVGLPRVPKTLNPRDIAWQKSRPKQPWRDRNGNFVHIARLEVLAADVIRVLCGGGSSSDPGGASGVPGNESRLEGLPIQLQGAVSAMNATLAVKKKPTTANEAHVVKALARQLRVKPHMATADAKRICSAMGLSLSVRGFRRAWQRARIEAGLDARARRGHKPKLPRPIRPAAFTASD